MKKCMYIGIFAFLGAMLRYFVKNIHWYNYREVIPINTIIINVIGSFFMAAILTTSYEIKKIKEEVRLGITTGLLGAFTTFSTFCKDAEGLMQHGMIFSALSYLIISILLGLLAAYFGVVTARNVVSRMVIKNQTDEESKEDAV